MNTIIFYIAGAVFIGGGIVFHFSVVLLGIGVFLLGIAVGGSIGNSIWSKLIEARDVLRALGYDSRIK